MENNERQIMDEAERRFKVKKIEKYTEMKDETKKEIIGSMLLSISFALSFMSNYMKLQPVSLSNDVLMIICYLVTIFVPCAVATVSFATALEKILLYLSLQTDINTLNNELKLDDELQKIKRK